MAETPETDLDLLVDQLATLRQIIVEREGEDVADQFEVGKYIITVNVEGSNYADAEDEANQYIITRIQVERGPHGMEELVGALIEQGSVSGDAEPDGFAIPGEDTHSIVGELEQVCEEAYRHWHWLDQPREL